MFAPDVQLVACAVRDDQYGTLGRKILSLFKKLDARLQHGAATSSDAHTLGHILRGHILLLRLRSFLAWGNV